jgi:hypothetical protein
LSAATSRSIDGSMKAAVLPVPVWAMPSRSRPVQHGRDGLRLDRRRHVVAFQLERLEDGLRKPEFGNVILGVETRKICGARAEMARGGGCLNDPREKGSSWVRTEVRPGRFVRQFTLPGASMAGKWGRRATKSNQFERMC